MTYKVIIGNGKFYYLDPTSMKEALLNNRVMEVRDEDDDSGIVSNYRVGGEVDREVLDLYYKKVLESEASKEIYPDDLMDMIYKLIDSAENKIEDQEIIDLTAMLINMEITHFLIIVYLLKVKQITDLGDLRLLLSSGMKTRVEKINKLLDNAIESSDASSISISSVRDAIKRDFAEAGSLFPPDTPNTRREDTTETEIYKQKMVEYAVTVGTTMFTKIVRASENLRGFKDLTYKVVSDRLNQLNQMNEKEEIVFDSSFLPPLFQDTSFAEKDFLLVGNPNYKSSFAGQYLMLKLIGLRFDVNPDERDGREKYDTYGSLTYNKKDKTMTAYVAGVQKAHSLMSILGYTGPTSKHRNILLEDAQKNIIRDIVSKNKDFDPNEDIKGLDGVRNIGYITSNLNTLYKLKSNTGSIDSFRSLRASYDSFIDEPNKKFEVNGVFSSNIEKYTASVFEGDNYRKDKKLKDIYDSITKENFFELGIEDHKYTDIIYIKEVLPLFQRKTTTLQSIGIGLGTGVGATLGGIAGFFGGVTALGAVSGGSGGYYISKSMVDSTNKKKSESRNIEFEKAIASDSDIQKFLDDTKYYITNEKNVMMRDEIIEKYLSDIPKNPIKGEWSNNLHYIQGPKSKRNVFYKESIIHSLPFAYSIEEIMELPSEENTKGNIQLSNLSAQDTEDYYYIIDKIMDSSGSLIKDYYTSDDIGVSYFDESNMKDFGDKLHLQNDPSYIRDFLINLRNKVVAYDGEDILYEVVNGEKVDLTTDELEKGVSVERSKINYINKIMVAKSLIIDYINYVLDTDVGVKNPDDIFSLQLKSNQIDFTKDEEDENVYPLYFKQTNNIYDVNYAPFLEVVFITEYIRNYTMKFRNIGEEINRDPVFQMVQGLKLTSAKLNMGKFQGLMNLMPERLEIEREAQSFLNNKGGGVR